MVTLFRMTLNYNTVFMREQASSLFRHGNSVVDVECYSFRRYSYGVGSQFAVGMVISSQFCQAILSKLDVIIYTITISRPFHRIFCPH